MRPFDVNKMRVACRIAAETLKEVERIIRPGITTGDIDKFVHADTLKRGGWPAPLNYRGFPKSCCTSVNDVVCHGIPGSYVLQDGDIVNVDVTTIVDGHFGDTNATFQVGTVDTKVQHLIALASQAMYAGIRNAVPGRPLNDVGRIIENMAKNHGYSVVKQFGGHGIGTRFHMDPHVAHYDTGDDSVILKVGDVITVEPIFNQGSPVIQLDSDGWTVRTADGLPSAQWEHTILITETGSEILTRVNV